MPDRDALPTVAAFTAIYLVWGSTFLAIRYAVETIPPYTMMSLRCLGGGAILVGLWRLREPGSPWPSAREAGGCAVLGLLFFVTCHGLLAREEQFVPSGMAALCAATIPLFVPILTWLVPGGGRPGGRTSAALGAGFLGVAMLVAAQGSGGGLAAVDASLLLLMAFSWAAGTVATRLVPVPSSPLAAAGLPLLWGAAMLAVVSLVSGESGSFHAGDVTGRSLGGLAYLIVMGTVVTFSAYMWLLRHTAPTRVATYAFVNPAVAVVLGWAVAGEHLSAGTLLATAVIIAAVAVAVSDRPRPQLEAPPPSASPSPSSARS
ncbi:MAG TPA: EamA family transporter [Gaiellales bacterium]